MARTFCDQWCVIFVWKFPLSCGVTPLRLLPSVWRLFFRKLEKAVAVSGVFAGVLEGSSGQMSGIAKCLEF